MATGWDSDYTYRPRPLFEETFACLPFSKYKTPHLERGDKIILPASSLSQIISLPMKYPLIFQIESYNSDQISHCGVLEFEAEEGCVHMPDWMMKNLKVREGDLVILRDASLSKACFMKLQPHATVFTELSDPRAVLERTLRDFTCASRGDTIMVGYGGRDFYFDVLEVVPGDAVSLIDTDCQVDFAPPLDYKEPGTGRDLQEIREKGGNYGDYYGRGEEREEAAETTFVPFRGNGQRLDGKAAMETTEIQKGGNYGRGEEREEAVETTFVPFRGKGRRLDGKAAMETTEIGAVVEGISKLVVGREGKKKREKDGGKEERKEFKTFTGRSYVLGVQC